MDDYIIISKTTKETEAIFANLRNKGFKMKDKRTNEEYIGILIMYGEDGSFIMAQPHLLDRINEQIPGMKETRSATTLASVGIVLTKDGSGDLRKELLRMPVPIWKQVKGYGAPN